MYEIVIAIKARKELKKLSAIHQTSILQVFQDLRENPDLGKPLTREFSNRFSYRLGVFRIIYKVNKKEKIVTIISAGHRSVVYN